MVCKHLFRFFRFDTVRSKVVYGIIPLKFFDERP